MTNNFDPNQLRGQPKNKGSWAANENGDPETSLRSDDEAVESAANPEATLGASGAAEANAVRAKPWVEYRELGQLHSSTGAAVVHEDGSEEFWLHGERMMPPEEDYRLQNVTPSGIIQWRAGDNRTVDIHPDGLQLFFRDGDLHRDGAPAAIFSDGKPPRWFRGGTEQANPVPEATTATTAKVDGVWGQVTTRTGAKFEEGRAITAISKDLRGALAHAKELQYIPEHNNLVNYAVTHSDTKRGGRRITVTVSGFSHADLYGPNDDTFLTPETMVVKTKLQKIVDSYNQVAIEDSGDYLKKDFDGDVRFEDKGVPGVFL